jgi:hypothetical protein
MKRKKKVHKSKDEELDEDDRLMFEVAKKNEKARKCGTYRQNKAFPDD